MFLDVLAVLGIPNVADQKPVVTSETTALQGYGLTGIVFRPSTVYAGHNVRVVLRPAGNADARAGPSPRRDKNKEPWFVLKDVCEILEHDNPSLAKRRLDEHDLSTVKVIDSLGRSQQVSTVNESGLYDVIFQSRKPEAKRFRRWVTNEVLPAIRKTGAYISDSILDSDDPWTLLGRRKPPYSGRLYRHSLERECFTKLRVTHHRSAQTANQAE